MKSIDWTTLGGLFAVSGAIFFFVLAGLAISQYPNYSMTGNFLSDLGVNGKSDFLFNTACAVSGTSLFGLAGCASRRYRGALARLGQASLAFAGAALAGVGAFTLYQQPMHTIAAGSFFLLMPIALLLIGVALWREHELILEGKVTIGIGGLTLILFPFVTSPIGQKVAVGLFLVWALLAGAYLLSKDDKGKKRTRA